MGLNAFIVSVISSAIFFGSQRLYKLFFTSEADKALFNSGTRTSRRYFCRALDKKLLHYDLPVRWLVYYINVLMPSITIGMLSGMIPDSAGAAIVPNAAFIVRMVFIVFCIINTVIIRGVDSLSFWVNIAFMVAWLVNIIISLLGPLLLLADIFVLPAAVCNIVYFVKRRKLFFLSAKQLAAQNEL